MREKRKEVRKMLKAEVVKKIEELETQQFYLMMKDRWTPNDYRTNRELTNEIRKLKAVLK